VAKERGYFAQEGLDVEFKLFESGHLAVKDLLAGRVDLATASEFAAVSTFMRRPDLRIVSIIDRAQDQELIARKDRGIEQLSDLRGRRIGLAKGSSAEYYLHLLLVLQDIALNEVQMVNVLPTEQLYAVKNGDVDAVLTWEPFTAMVKRGLGINGVSWPGQSGLRDYWLLLSTTSFIRRHPRTIQLFVKALSSAENFLKNNDGEARRIMSKQLAGKFEDSRWDRHQFRLALDRPLLLKMEAEFAWLKSKQRSEPFDMPDLRESIYFDSLKAVRPARVKLLY
jgi:NitT/TauT family transport system substrate-binding protein